MNPLLRNKKGQFSIIAALLVAVVIIATVITTYASIRYDVVPDQPQILSAVDETNLALKQLLGFTVGYYGSILQVTGNTSYAQRLASNYLRSGLANIADIKPEWSLSFKVNSLNMHIDWFEPTSISAGEFNVTYSLAGLGLYNLTYEKQSSLNVETLEPLNGKARVSVQIEENEPLVTLSSSSFKFYRYDMDNQIWQLVPLAIEPEIFANGTYLLTVPSGVDANEFMVKVEDARGIVTVASSFSRYVSVLNWGSSSSSMEDYVDTNFDLYTPANKGSHSDFVAQKNADSVYDTLTEVSTGGGITDTKLIDGASFETDWSGFVASNSYWSRGSSQHYDGSYSAFFDGAYSHSGTLASPNIDCSGATAIYVDFWYMDAGCESGEFELEYFDGSHWDTLPNEIGDLGKNQSTSGWLHYQDKITDSQYFKSNFAIRFSMHTNMNSDDAYVDLVTVTREVDNRNYELDLEEQWTNLSLANPNMDLCIKTGALGTESLRVDVWHDGSWVNNIINGLSANTWNNVSISSWVSENLTIRFRGGSETSDPSQSSWMIDAALIRPQSELGALLASQQDSKITVEWLQNGTIRWLGQNIQLATSGKPIPPISAKALHLTQIRDGISVDVPFQVEDWTSQYQVPLGLTSEATVLSNRQMIVFQLDRHVTSFALWWDGSDQAIQTHLAYTPHVSYNQGARTMDNGRLTIQFASSGFTITSTAGSSTSTSRFMRINSEYDTTDPEYAFAITNGPVRNIVLGEPEYGGGAEDCPNLYASVVITLPADTSYFTYQLRFMFINSPQQSRTVRDLCLLSLTSSLSSLQFKTENGTSGNSPIVTSGAGTFRDYDASSAWTAHHWSQFTSGSNGAGIIIPDATNQKLYTFDSMAGTPTGALNVDPTSKTIELAPVTSLHQVSFQTPMDITWKGAIATFSSSTPVYDAANGNGLWILAEYQPQITITAAA